MIVRSARPHLNYSVVHNSLIEDESLSWKARGILIYLLSKPDHWRTSTAHLASVSPEGIHAVRTGLQELERAGYVKRIRKQNPSGQWTMHTVVFDQPQPVDKWTSGHTSTHLQKLSLNKTELNELGQTEPQ